MSSVICSKCWEALFSTPEFQSLCRTPGEGEIIQYTATNSEVEASAASGCNWCRLLLSLKSDAEKITLGEGHPPLQQFSVRFGARPEGENFTPPGHNRFSFWINGASNFHAAFNSGDDLISGAVTAREREYQVNSPKAFDQVKKWLKECSSHKNCGVVGADTAPFKSNRSQSWKNPGTPRLLESNTMIDYYVALSYCWGPNQTGLTTKSNIKARQQRLEISSLSRTLQDAILVTRKIGIKYLWIDTICMIKDSQEDKTKNWRRCARYIKTH